MISKLKFTQLIGLIWIVCSCSVNETIPRYEDFPKIDAHVHIRTADSEIMQFAKKENFKLITLCTSSGSSEFIKQQLDFATTQRNKFPQTIAYITTFSMERFKEPGWQDEVIKKLEKDFEDGAIGVKVWKDIGMTFRDSLGNFIMIDDQRFDSIFNFIKKEGKVVVAHIGEPKNCWLPIDSMTVNNDKSYFAANPQYHMYQHPDYPSYDDQINARDRWLAKNTDLRVVGAHLGSLEWSVDELAKRLDRYPNFAVDMAARICHFQVQNSKKVRDFIVKYQDRLIYSTDIISDNSNSKEVIAELNQEWRADWRYFTTEDEMSTPKLDSPFMGLGLDVKVLRKIYHDNVIQWYPGVFQ
ncbi:amidohydrolase [Maribellus luteus]|uniref:Amidohydrolase n=1 Tax=Maribellus luteus TaxID=2305463 RepID=A0A399T120_9BACT|nr:amidohydrolase family protein [Maribellus luteus]RIJ49996.1 amidohydrolase [Maribellus luteus]